MIASDIHYPTDASLLFEGLRRLRQKLVKDPRVRGHLEAPLGLTDRVVDQSAKRLAGGKPTNRVVSLADPGGGRS